MAKTLAETLEVLFADISPNLVAPEVRKNLRNIGVSLPDVLRGGLECRLDEQDNQVDLQLCVTRDSAELPLLVDFVRSSRGQKACNSSAWNRLEGFLCDWESKGSVLHEHVAEIWLEFDCLEDGTVSPPSVFVGFLPTPIPFDTAQTVLNHVLEHFVEKEIRDQRLELLLTCIGACKEGTFIGHLGFLLGRDSSIIRVNVKKLNTRNFISFLNEINWAGDLKAAQKMFERMFSLFDRLTFCLDVGEKIEQNYGIECILRRDTDGIGRWKNALYHVSSITPFCPKKLASILEWPSELTHGERPKSWPRQMIATMLLPETNQSSVLQREISHIKLACIDSKPHTAKAYLWFAHLWKV